jgi:hypothetical protein
MTPGQRCQKESNATNLYSNRAASTLRMTSARGARRSNDAAIEFGTSLAMKGFA